MSIKLEDILSKGLYNLFSVWWLYHSLKVKTLSQTWHIFNLYRNNSNISDNI